MTAPAPAGPLSAYRDLISQEKLRPDAAQERAVEKLQALHEDLVNYAPNAGIKGWRARLGLASGRVEPPKSLYMHGGTGRGKSMLMEVLFETAPVDEKKQVHFHAFILEVHERVHRFREAAKAGKVAEEADPLAALARVIADKAWLLCFDEFHVTNIADAMILGRLFEALFEAGTVVVTTSNRPPQDLYKGGLQRERFLPFIDLIEKRMDVFELAGDEDHRLTLMKEMQVYLSPADAAATAQLEADFERLTLGVEAVPKHIDVQGREVHIPKVVECVAFVTFDELCRKALGAADYLAVAERFDTLVMDGIPKLGPDDHNEAKRFVTLIDTLYEHKVNLICAADAAPHELYVEGPGSFEFDRTVSRLIEMQSDDYIHSAHGT